MTLTKNFTLEELAPHDHKALAKVAQTDERVRRIAFLAFNLQSFRDFYGKPIKVTSGYRSPAYNKQIGGSPTSQHTTGFAADLKPADGNMADMQRAVLLWAQTHDFDQIILEQQDKNGLASWIHFGIKHATKGMRHQVLTAKKVNGKWVYANYEG